jgi:hypothetical protein
VDTTESAEGNKMAIRFRKSMKIMPGVRVTLGKSGISGSLGTNGARVSVNSKGQVRGTAGLNGTGLSSTTMLNGKSKATKSDEDTTNEIAPIAISKEDVPNISLFMVVIPWILLGAFVHEWLGFAWLALMIPVWLFNKFLRFAAEYPSLIPGMQEELDVIAKERAEDA